MVKKANTSYVLYVIKEIAFSLFATLKILNLIKNLRRKDRRIILHAFDTVYGGLAAAVASKLTGVPLISQTHGLRTKFIRTITSNRFLIILDYLIEKFVINQSKFLISVNKEALIFWECRGIQKYKLKLLRVPVDLEVFKPNVKLRKYMRVKFGLNKKTFVIGYVGRLSPEKNVEILLRAFNKARQKESLLSSKLFIVGDGLQRDRLKNLSISLSLSKDVIFTGFRRDIPLLLNGMDVLVLPSLIEGNPTVVLEAMASGVPVVCSNIPAHREIISHMRNGMLFSVNDVNELACILSLLYRNKKLLERLRKAGRTYVKSKNNINKIINALKKLYFEAVSNPNSY